jgi:hypothetical protein
MNGDITSGNPVGFGIGPSTYYRGARTTASLAYLSSPPPNLTILTNSIISKVILDTSKRAIGVSTLLGQVYHASKEVILSAGAFDTPKILLLFGIGLRRISPNTLYQSFTICLELEKLEGPLLHFHSHPLERRGTCYWNTRSHCDSPSSRPRSDADTGAQTPMAWLSSPIVKASPEFYSLRQATKYFLQKSYHTN